MTTHYEKIENFNKKLHNFGHLGAMVGWDEAVNMPEGSGEARAQALSELYVYMAEQKKDPQVMEWVEKAKSEDLSVDQKRNVLLVEKNWKQANVLPTEFVRKQSLVNMKSNQAWRKLRAENNWKAFEPLLTEVVELVKEEAALRSEATGLEPYNALLDLYEPGLRTDEVNELFTELKQELPKIRDAVLEKQKETPFLKPEGPFATDAQKSMGQEIMQALGFDFNRGRLDVSHHPFCGGMPEDVRLTTRYNENDFTEALMGIIHETGHARYEQSLPKAWVHQPLGSSQGMAIHEGQSLFFEMQIGRSDEFIQYALPIMKQHLFNDKTAEAWSLENMTRLYQNVENGLIRVDADEVTYPFHVILRYEIEQALISGKVSVKELPELWNAKMQEYLGLSTEGNYKDGVMQDVHWPSGSLGYFPTYTFGAMVAAQVFAKLAQDLPSVKKQISQGQFSEINQWLEQNVWSQGARFELGELIPKVTGKKLGTDAFLKHLEARYL